jgi:glycosyltransferase involved in cell wall biosynthesis
MSYTYTLLISSFWFSLYLELGAFHFGTSVLSGYFPAVTRRILLLVTDLEIGGTPTVVRELAVRLNAFDGLEVEVACLARWGPVADELKRAGVTVHALAAQSMRDLGVIARFIALAHRRGYDTVFSFLVHANLVAAVGRKLLRYRLIESIQTTQPRPRWHWWVQRLARGSAERIVVPSISAARAAQDWAKVDRDKIVVIPNAVEVESFAQSPVPAENPQPYPIGFVGRLDPIKRVPMLVRSLLAVKRPVVLHIFGEGPERAEIEAAIHTHGLEPIVRMHGAIARPQEALEQIGLLVLPSAAEGFGLVLIEAMAAGVPVVGTNVMGIRDVIHDGETGLLVGADDEPGLAAAIDRIVGERELRNQLIASAARYVREHYTWAQVLPKYRELLAATNGDWPSDAA